MADVLFSRSERPDGLGKNSAEIKVLLPEDLKEKLLALAALRESNISAYVRDVLLAHVYGQFHLIRLRTEGRNGE